MIATKDGASPWQFVAIFVAILRENCVFSGEKMLMQMKAEWTKNPMNTKEKKKKPGEFRVSFLAES